MGRIADCEFLFIQIQGLISDFCFSHQNPLIIMTITYYGQSCFGMNLYGKDILFDPFITPNDLAKDVNVDDIPADYILITHAHFDHTADVEKIADRTKAKIVSNWEICGYYEEKGYEVQKMNHGGQYSFDFGNVRYVAAVHTSSFQDGTYGGNPGGFVIWGDNYSFYHAGDTALTMDMKLIPMTCPKLNFAIFPIGDVVTMGIQDAVTAAEFVGVNKVIGCHFDTFPFLKINHDVARQAFSNKQKELVLPEIGKPFTV